jgi:hypothetical protein
MADLQASLKAERSATVDGLCESQSSRVANVQADHSTAVDELEKAHFAAITSLRAELQAGHSAAVEGLEKAHSTAVTSLRADLESDCSTAVDELEKDHSTAMTNLQAGFEVRHSEAVAEMLKSQSTEVSKLRKDLQNEHSTSVTELMKNHSAALADLRNDLEAEHSTTVDKLIQGHSTAITDLRNELEAANSTAVDELTLSHSTVITDLRTNLGADYSMAADELNRGHLATITDLHAELKRSEEEVSGKALQAVELSTAAEQRSGECKALKQDLAALEIAAQHLRLRNAELDLERSGLQDEKAALEVKLSEAKTDLSFEIGTAISEQKQFAGETTQLSHRLEQTNAVLYQFLELVPTQSIPDWNTLFVTTRTVEAMNLECKIAVWLSVAPELAVPTVTDRPCRENAFRLFALSFTSPTGIALGDVYALAAQTTPQSLSLVIASTWAFIRRRATGPQFSTAGAVVFLRCIGLVFYHLQGRPSLASLQSSFQQAQQLLASAMERSALVGGFCGWLGAVFASSPAPLLTRIAECAAAQGRSVRPKSRPDLDLIAESKSLIIHSDAECDRLRYFCPNQFRLELLRVYSLIVESYPNPGQRCSIPFTFVEMAAAEKLFVHAIDCLMAKTPATGRDDFVDSYGFYEVIYSFRKALERF